MRAEKVTKGKRVVRHKRASASKDANLLVRCDTSTKKVLERAASIRGLSLSDYVRTRIVPLAKQDVEEADTGVLRLPREAQIAFWQALQNPPPLTEAQRELGRSVRDLLQQMPAPEGFKLELMSAEHRRKQFSSGNEKVDEWLRQKALSAMKKHTSTTRVLVDSDGRIAGYYTLANTSLDVSLVPPGLFGGQAPRRPPPTVTLAWLGVDEGFAGRGLGTYLFHQALADCVKVYDMIRYVAVIIDALDDENVAYYQLKGFTLVPGTTHKLYIAASVLQSVVG